MNLLNSIIAGIIQGLTEFLPVSSSGHLAVFQNIFGYSSAEMSNVTFTLLLHVGTLASVLLVYYKDVWGLIKSFFSLLGKLFTGKFKYSQFNNDEKFFCLLFIALLPLALGAVLENAVEFVSNYTSAVGILWILNGLLLIFGERIKSKQKNFSEITPKNAFIVGLYQLIAIFPGISRSGMTITGGLMNGFKREFAVKFSFILSIPAILGSVAVTVIKDHDVLSASGNMGAIAAGMAAAFISGLAAIQLLNYITKKHSFRCFSYYCFAAGALAIIYSILA